MASMARRSGPRIAAPLKLGTSDPRTWAAADLPVARLIDDPSTCSCPGPSWPSSSIRSIHLLPTPYTVRCHCSFYANCSCRCRCRHQGSHVTQADPLVRSFCVRISPPLDSDLVVSVFVAGGMWAGDVSRCIMAPDLTHQPSSFFRPSSFSICLKLRLFRTAK